MTAQPVTRTGATVVEPEPREPRTTAVARDASTDDLDRIDTLLNWWSKVGLTLPREREEIAEHIDQFAVAVRDGVVVACGALELIPGGVAEIRSVSVDPDAKGTGAGRAVVGALVQRAKDRGVRRLCLLTRTPEFFARCGFEPIPAKALCPTFVEFALRASGRTTAGRTCMEFPSDQLAPPGDLEDADPARGVVVTRPIV